MEYSVVSKIIDLLVERCKDAFSGLKGKIKLHCIKKNLENEVFNEILSAHGDKVFYNDLDRFLVDNDVICNIIRNCCDTYAFLESILSVCWKSCIKTKCESSYI